MSKNTFTFPELLPPEAAVIVEAAKFDLMTLQAPVSVVYDRFYQRLEANGFVPPSLRSFRRWAEKQRQRPLRIKCFPTNNTRTAVMTDAEQRTPFPLTLSDQTRRLLASGLRSLAEDLERDLPKDADDMAGVRQAFLKAAAHAGAPDPFREAIRTFLGLPEGFDPEFARGTTVRIPMARRAR